MRSSHIPAVIEEPTVVVLVAEWDGTVVGYAPYCIEGERIAPIA